MYIFSLDLLPKDAQPVITDVFVGLQTVNPAISNYISQNADLVLGQSIDTRTGKAISTPVVDTISFVFRNLTAFGTVAEIWHALLEPLLPVRSWQYKYREFFNAAVAAGYKPAQVIDIQEGRIQSDLNLNSDRFKEHSIWGRTLEENPPLTRKVNYNIHPTWEIQSPIDPESQAELLEHATIYFMDGNTKLSQVKTIDPNLTHTPFTLSGNYFGTPSDKLTPQHWQEINRKRKEETPDSINIDVIFI